MDFPLYMSQSRLQQEHLAIETAHSKQFVKRALMLYILLLIFEGALRKWFLPALAGPLLIVRDPLAILILAIAIIRGFLLQSLYVPLMVIISLISFLTSLTIGHENLAVAVYGVRIMLFHFPLIFVMGNVFTRDDLYKVGNMLLWLTIGMTVLIALQFYSPQSAWVNRGVGGSLEGAGFAGAGIFMRPPGTFSFTTGVSQFYGFVTPFIFNYWLNSEAKVNKLLLIAATISLMLAIPFSISRGLLFQVGVTFLFALVAVSRNPKYMGRMLLAVIAMVFLGAILSNYPVFSTAIDAFSGRFESAGKIEGGLKGTLIDRFLGGMHSAITESDRLPFFGYGIGMGTNVGSQLLTGKIDFLIAEGEWARVIGEMGPLLGLSTIILRVALTVDLTLKSFSFLKMGDIFPLLLLSFAALGIAQGGWAQPTSLGFCIIGAGILMASFNRAND